MNGLEQVSAFELVAVVERGARRLALTPAEAAAAIGVSRDFFDLHVMPELRAVRRGRRVMIAVRELERWLEESAARTLEADG